MNINIQFQWDSLDPRWEVFNKTELAKIIECPAGKAVIRYFLFEISGNRLAVLQENVNDQIIGEIGFTPEGLREILGVKRLTRDLRNSHSTFVKINNYILNRQ